MDGNWEIAKGFPLGKVPTDRSMICPGDANPADTEGIDFDECSFKLVPGLALAPQLSCIGRL